MSFSRKSSFETIFEKGDPLQFIANPDDTREQLDLKGLSDSARKSFATLRQWQQAMACYDHPLVQTIINKIVEHGDTCHSAIKKTVANAQQGHAFADEVIVFCDALAEKHDSPERLNELLSNLIKVAEKAHRHSIKTRAQLKRVCDGLSEISKDMKSQVSKMEGDTLFVLDPDNDTSFNGVNTCFVTFPKSTVAPVTPVNTWAWSQPNILPGAEDTSDSDDEDTITCPVKVDYAPTWNPPAFRGVKHMSFANAEDQLMRIVGDVSSFVEHFERCVDWWGGMKAGLDGLKHTLPRIIMVTRGWGGVADQFALYIHRMTPLVMDYQPHSPFIVRNQYASPCIPWTPPPMPSTIPGSVPVVPPEEAQQPKPLWKRLTCVL